MAGIAEAKERADRPTLQRRLGDQGVVDLDRRTGTPRVLARLDGTLTGASSRSPESIAAAYVRANLGLLGLTPGDVSASPSVTALPGGVSAVSWRQSVAGIPSADHSLRVNVGADGRVLSVLGSPEHDLDIATTPSLDAGEAVRAVQDDVGVYRSLVRRRGPSGAQRTTDYGDDTAASLVTSGDRLAWRVRYRAADDVVYDATVDARTGDVLRRVNMVKSESPALVWERFPGSGVGGTATTVDLEQNGWLSATAANLDGPNAHVYSDLDDNGIAASSEEVARVAGGFSFPMQPVAGAGCDAAHLCAWSGTADRTLNRRQDAVQAFYLANRFHDHLAAAPIGFTAAKGAFEGADDLLLETMDGASTGPDGNHLNNANMFTPPDGSHPRMQMYLWSSPFRRVSSGSDAAIVYHEYTHGLSNRLVRDADGYGALNSAQAGAMGEAWSDWYAMDFIVDQFPSLDTGAAGEVTMGAYTDLSGASSKLRYSPLDCPVAAADPVACPGRPALGSGGFSYGDFGRVAGGAEVHADGEIWAQTLWDLRTAVGSAKARALVTTGMSLLPPEPSFLDGRNGILLADQTLFGGADAGVIWSVFAGRGMGFFAAATSGEDTAPAENFALPPAADAPRGTISGQVTNAIGGAGVPGVTVGLAGGISSVSAVTGADGRYTIPDVPAGTYLKVLAGGGGWDSAVTSLSVSGGGAITYSPVVKRDWVASKGGASVTSSNGREYVEFGCGPNAALDQSQSLGWSTAAGSDKYLIVQLPVAVDVTSFGIDPAETCGDGPADATAGYRVETSADGTTWTVARTGTFTTGDRHTLNALTPAAGATGVKYARLTLLSSQGGASASFRDLSEFAVYGTPTATLAPDPDTTLAPGGPPFTFTSTDPDSTFECALDAGAFTPCTSPFTPGTLSDGDHVFSVRAIGDPTPATRTFTVDTTAPETTIDSGPGPFVFSSSEAGSSFECKVDDGEFAACTSPDARVFADGEHTFSVRAKDAAGNVDPTPATKRFTVDNTPPETTIESGVSGRTRDTTPRFVFSSSETGSTFECRVNGAPFTSCASPQELGPLVDGEYTFEVRATDAAGHTDQSPAALTFTVDTTPPDTVLQAGGPPFRFSSSESGAATFECKVDSGAFAACTSPYDAGTLADGDHVFMVRATDASGNTDQSPATATFSVDTTAPETTIDSGPSPFRFSSSETASTFQCRLDGGDFATCNSPRDLGTLSEGTHTFDVRATDAAGNTDQTPASQTFVVDRTGPTVTSVGGPPNRSNDKTPTFTFASDEGDATFECKLSAPDHPGTFAPCTSPIDYGPLEDARYTFTVRATDAAGNTGTDATVSYTLYTTPPETGISSGPNGLTNDADPVFVLASSPPGATFTCSLNGTPIPSCTTPLALHGLPDGGLPDGTYRLEVTATDDAGNVDPTPVVRTFTVDTTPPEALLDSGPTSPVHSGLVAFAVRALGGTPACSLDAGEYGSCAAIILADKLTPGDHIFRVRAEDAAGNISAPLEYTFTVVNEAPTAALVLDALTGTAPFSVRPAISGADPDGDRLTYQLAFGDGQVATGVLPAVLVAHRYGTPGAYTVKLTVSDGRATATDTRAVTVTTPQVLPYDPPPPDETPLSLTLSASSLSLGTFIPGVARDYAATLTATTTGNGTLTVSDPSPSAPGHLVGLAGALAQPLQVKAIDGALAPLTAAVAIPAAVEFHQAIGADEVLKPGGYGKALTFTYAVTTP